METNYINHIKIPPSKEMVNTTLKQAENLTQILLESPVIKEEIDHLSIKVEVKEDHNDYLYSASAEKKNISSSLLVKLEPEWNLPLENCNSQSLLNNSYTIFGSSFDGSKDSSFEDTKPSVKIENSEAVNEINFDDVKIKNEEVDFKEEDLEDGLLKQNEKSASFNCIDQEKPIFKCEQCIYQTVYSSSLKRHLLKHKNPEEVKIFKCYQCSHQTYRYDSLRRHQLRHGDSDIFKCDYCDYLAIQKVHLEMHLLQHTNSVTFKCNHCSYKTLKRGYLKMHLLGHTNLKNMLKCKQCSYQTFKNSVFNRHLVSHKNPNGNKLIKCRYCEFQTINTSNFKTHLLQHAKTKKEEIFECDQCSYQTKRYNYFQRHQLGHNNPKKLIATIVCIKLMKKDI